MSFIKVFALIFTAMATAYFFMAIDAQDTVSARYFSMKSLIFIVATVILVAIQRTKDKEW
jgi:hypothetical protein